jgi:hypothetical protein
MAGAVGAAVGVVSTVAGMGEQSRQRNIQRKQAEVQQYAQEVQYEQEKMAIKHQKEFAAQTRALEDMQLKTQDMQMGNALNEQALEARQEEQSLTYQVGLKQVQDQSALQTASQALDLATYQQGEMQRQRNAQADSRQQEVVGQVGAQQSELAKYLADGNNAQAAAMLMNATQGQQDSVSSDIQTNRRGEIANSLRTLMEQGNLTDEAVRQALYEKDVASSLKDVGLYDVMLERIGATAQYDTSNSMTSAQSDLIKSGKKKNAIGEQLARTTLAGGTALRDQQRNIDARFGDMGYSAQTDNAGIRNAGIMSSLQAQQASSRGSLFTTLANAAALGGSLYNAYNMMRPTAQYSSPVRGQSSQSLPTAKSSQQFGPALPQVGPYGPVDIRG